MPEGPADVTPAEVPRRPPRRHPAAWVGGRDRLARSGRDRHGCGEWCRRGGRGGVPVPERALYPVARNLQAVTTRQIPGLVAAEVGQPAAPMRASRLVPNPGPNL